VQLHYDHALSVILFVVSGAINMEHGTWVLCVIVQSHFDLSKSEAIMTQVLN